MAQIHPTPRGWRGIVGTGVVACEFCCVIEWNRRKCSRRTGIFVTRSDGSSECLHPPRCKHTKLYEAHAVAACPDQATSSASPQQRVSVTDDAAISAAAASTCVPQRARDVATAAPSSAMPQHQIVPLTDNAASPAAAASTSVPQRAVAAYTDVAAISVSPSS